MRPFDYVRADDVAAAVALVKADPEAHYLAGGTTELDLVLKDGVLVVGVSAAIANAVYHATGRRIRSLPITVEQLL